MAAPLNIVSQGFDKVTAGGLEMIYAYAYALFDGVTSVSVDVQLARNALVDDYRFLLQAKRVDSTKVQEVAQVRSYESAGSDELVIDFGTPRTVSGIDLPGDANVFQVFPWLGSQFSPTSAMGGSFYGPLPASPNAVFPELRTERLRVVISRALSGDEISEVRLRLPEPPSGLELRIDDGPPVWSHPEPVQPRANVETPDADGWDKDSKRIVDLRSALAALAGDPLAADDPVAFKVTLSTKVPCQLDLDVHGTPQLRRVRRVRFDGETTAALDFASEGLLDVALALPAPPAGQSRRIDELRWTAVADLPPERVLPPVGPDAAAGASEPVLAELFVDPERAVCVRLPAGSGLAELTAIRLPLRALGDGAEARVVLWSVAADAALPVVALPQGASEPVTLTAGATEQWVTFGFKQAVPVDAALMPWMALIVARGELSWALARSVAGDPVDAQVIRRGPPNGPWKALPAPLQSASGVLDARARLRLAGHAAKAATIAPLTIALAGAPPGAASAAIDLNPTPKGAPGVLLLDPGLTVAADALAALRLISRVAGSLQLRDIDVVSNH